MSGLNALSIVSIQYELILTLRHGDDLDSMINRFMRTCIKRVGAASAQFYVKQLYPEWEKEGYLEDAGLACDVLKIPLRNADVIDWDELFSFLRLELDERPDQTITHFNRFGRQSVRVGTDRHSGTDCA